MRTIFFILFFVVGNFASAQFPLLSSVNQQNNIFINPAFTGSQDYLHANLLHRQQWQSFEDAPQLNAFAIGGPLRNEKIGIALQYKNSSSGVFASNQFQGDVNYILPLSGGSNKHKLIFGLGLGLQTQTIGFNTAITASPNDPSFSYGVSSEATAIIASGIFYKSNKQAIGISVPNFLDKKNFTIYYQRKFIISSQSQIDINMLHRNMEGVYHLTDFQLRYGFREKISLGAGYRSNKTLSAILGIKLLSQLSLYFAYDFATSNSMNVPMNSSEFSIQYEFGKKIESTNPRPFH